MKYVGQNVYFVCLGKGSKVWLFNKEHHFPENVILWKPYILFINHITMENQGSYYCTRNSTDTLKGILDVIGKVEC